MGVDGHGPVVLALFPMACGSWSYLKKAKAVPKPVAKDLKSKDFQKIVFNMINRYRKSVKLKPLRLSSALTTISLNHSNEMCKAGKIYHFSPITGRPDARVKKFGIKPLMIAENVAVASSPKAVVDSWILSTGHRQNLVLKKAIYGGVGICKGTIGKTNVYYATFMTSSKF